MNECIPQIVGEYFIRTCKTHNLYNVFKKRFHPEIKKNYFCSPFDAKCQSITDMFKIVGRNVTKSEQRRSKDKYEDVTIVINTLLQYYLEGGGVNPSTLGSIGQEIFNLSCYRIYGQDFLNDMAVEQQTIQNHNPKNEFDHFAYGQYMHLYHDGRINCSYEDFLSQYGEMLKKHFQDIKKHMMHNKF